MSDGLASVAKVLTAYLSNHHVPPTDIPLVSGEIRRALDRISSAASTLSAAEASPTPPAAPTPVVSIRASIKPEALICLACGSKFKALKRHIAAEHGWTPAAYRETYGLPISYPMVAADYAARRSALARQIGLGAPRKAQGADPNSSGTLEPPKASEPVDEAPKPAPAVSDEDWEANAPKVPAPILFETTPPRRGRKKKTAQSS